MIELGGSPLEVGVAHGLPSNTIPFITMAINASGYSHSEMTSPW